MAYRPRQIQGSSVGGFTAGSIPFAAADGTLTQDNTNLSWDDANDNLTLGNAVLRNDRDAAAVSGTNAQVMFSEEQGTVNPRTAIGGLYPSKTSKSYWSRMASNSTTQGQINGSSIVLQQTNTTGDAVADWAAVDVTVTNGKGWGGNLIAACAASLTGVKLVGLEIDVQPAGAGELAGTGGGLFLNIFNDTGNGTIPAIQLGSGGGSGRWINGIVLDAIGTIGSGLSFNTGASGCASGVDLTNGTFSTAALVMNAQNMSTDTTTGTKIGTGNTQKLGFWNTTPVVQPAAEADIGAMTTTTNNCNAIGCDGLSALASSVDTHLATIRTKINNILAKLRSPGYIAT